MTTQNQCAVDGVFFICCQTEV